MREPDPAVERFGYRNKMEYSAAPGAGRRLALGFHVRGRWDEVVDVAACLLATPLGNAVRETVRALGRGRGTGALRPARPDGRCCATWWCARASRPARCW